MSDSSTLTDAFFTWLGVVRYLAEADAFTTLSFIGSLSVNAHVVFDYALPLGSVCSKTLRLRRLLLAIFQGGR